jgi:hypothetical protein
LALPYGIRATVEAVASTTRPPGTVDNSLSDDQKARFNSMGRQLFAQNGGRQSSNEQREAR